jgi:tetratricopeptide (TPR) repeat protein
MTDDDLTQLLALDAFPGPALALDAADADALVEGALTGAGFGPASGGPGHGGAGPAVRGGLATGTKLAIGALALAAAVVIAILVLRRSHGTHAAAPIDAAIDAPPDVATGSGSAPSPADGSGSADTGSAAATGSDASADDDIELDPEPAHPARPRPPETRQASDLLGEANAKRAAKQWRESDALYSRVVRRAPRSLAAQIALVASASIHLEHLGDPRGATARFQRALAIAPNGGLAEEARWGLAEAARARHDDAAEARALDDFLAHHAGSPLARRARARRSELP